MLASLLLAVVLSQSPQSDGEEGLPLVVSSAGTGTLERYVLDPETASLTKVGGFKMDGGCGPLAQTPDGRFLVVMSGNPTKLVVIDISGDTFAEVSRTPVDDGQAYVSVSPNGRFVACASYRGGTMQTHALADDGTISDVVQRVETERTAHAAVFDRSGRFLFVPHTVPNAIYQFRFDTEAGTFTPNDPPKLQRAENTGPRHLWFDDANRFAYGSDEQGVSLSVYRHDATAGTLTLEQTVSSAPADREPVARQNTSDIEVHPGGRFVSIANRGIDTIATFAIDPDNGRVTLVGHADTPVMPRSFNVSPDGRFVVAAGQKSHTLTTYRVTDGVLASSETIDCGKAPMWVQFLRPVAD